MDLDDVTLGLRTREQVRVALSEFPPLESDQERVTAARRLIRHAGKEESYSSFALFECRDKPVTEYTGLWLPASRLRISEVSAQLCELPVLLAPAQTKAEQPQPPEGGGPAVDAGPYGVSGRSVTEEVMRLVM